MHPMNQYSNFQDSNSSKNAQNVVSTFVKIVCKYIENKCENFVKVILALLFGENGCK